MTDVSEILIEDVTLITEKVLKVLRRYLLPFLSHRENPAGGRIFPPRSGARVNVADCQKFPTYVALGATDNCS